MGFVDTLIDRIEGAKCLDVVAAPLGSGVGRAVGSGRTRDLLSGTPLGHPVHPALADIPIGAWTAAAVLDVVGGERATPYAGLFVAMGIAAAVPTAATGWNDWSRAAHRPAPRRVGVVHAAANTTALALYVGSLVSRCRGRRCRGRLLGLAGYGALGLGAYLGGHLIFANAVNVDQNALKEDRQS